MKTSLVAIAILALSTGMFATAAQAADPLVPCDDGYTYKCHGLMCGCEADFKEELYFDIGSGGINSIGPGETLETVFSIIPLSSNSSCKITINYKHYDLDHGLVDQGDGLKLYSEHLSLVLEREFTIGSDARRQRMKLVAEGQAENCTFRELSRFNVSTSTYETATGRTISHETLPVTSTFSIENGEEPPVKPAYIFPAYRND